ncbi:hypothetical protein SDC9_143958 [bioreactor metagenome]|uniref:Uncharacterized protein n=1 Tax=bioreactor metagenome TaxID=1076179 RepID=A0A645E7H7_9ZZZZ
MGPHQQFVAVVHLFGKRVECLGYLGYIGNDGFLLIGKLCQVMFFNGGVDVEFHHFWVDKHHLHFRRMLFVQQRCDDRIQAHRLSLSGCSGDQQVRHFGQVKNKHLVGDGFSQRYRQIICAFLKFDGSDNRLHGYNLWLFVGYFYTDCPFTGHWGDNTNTQRRKAQGNIVFQVSNS